MEAKKMRKVVASLVLVFLLALGGTANADLMAIWDFGPDSSNYTEDVTTERVIGVPTLSLSGGDIDDDGKNGTAYTDAEGTFHAAGQGAAWDDVKVTGADAEWIITINTMGWENIAIRWDYKSEKSPSFDLEYEVGGSGQWIRILNNHPITDDWSWHSFRYDLSSISAIEDNPAVRLRMLDLDRDGNDKFVFDNLELTGVLAFAGHIIAWGDNEHGECNVPDGRDFATIAAGGSHNVALKTDGTLAARGDDTKGQCSNAPVGDDFVAVAAGHLHSLALKSDGRLAAWGDDTWGQLNVPPGYDFTAIAAGNYHNLALHSDGWLAAWGKDEFDQCRDTPAGTDFVAVAAGRWHSVALKSDGSLVAWGWDYHGQCDVPLGNDFVAISAGEAHNLALRTDGTLAAWGDDSYDECNVPDGSDFVAISAGYSHSLALRADGTLAAWGWNDHGQCDVPTGKVFDFIGIAAGGGHSVALTSKICTASIIGDFNGDCKVDFEDFAIFCFSWLECNLDPPEACWPH